MLSYNQRARAGAWGTPQVPGAGGRRLAIFAAAARRRSPESRLIIITPLAAAQSHAWRAMPAADMEIEVGNKRRVVAAPTLEADGGSSGGYARAAAGAPSLALDPAGGSATNTGAAPPGAAAAAAPPPRAAAWLRRHYPFDRLDDADGVARLAEVSWRVYVALEAGVGLMNFPPLQEAVTIWRRRVITCHRAASFLCMGVNMAAYAGQCDVNDIIMQLIQHPCLYIVIHALPPAVEIWPPVRSALFFPPASRPHPP